jgi:hypothetical protein
MRETKREGWQSYDKPNENTYCREDDSRETTTAKRRNTPHRQRSEASCASDVGHHPPDASLLGPTDRVDASATVAPSEMVGIPSSCCDAGVVAVGLEGDRDDIPMVAREEAVLFTFAVSSGWPRSRSPMLGTSRGVGVQYYKYIFRDAR